MAEIKDHANYVNARDAIQGAFDHLRCEPGATRITGLLSKACRKIDEILAADTPEIVSHAGANVVTFSSKSEKETARDDAKCEEPEKTECPSYSATGIHNWFDDPADQDREWGTFVIHCADCGATKSYEVENPNTLPGGRECRCGGWASGGDCMCFEFD